MDPATVFAICKENIQPLRHGRNATQLGTALRAQEDAEAQQILQQEKQMYEEMIKNYDGDDPLDNWYEYILWVEQSYPKSGHESPIAKLLQQCLATFEKETKYHQDRRFIRLWINYISMQKNPIELYQLLHRNGVGTMVADMYRAWAFELEQIEDYKRADEVYLLGISVRAEPLDELDYAHKNFEIAVARKMLGRTDDRTDVSLSEQRQAFSSLKAIKAGKRVGSIRTGHRVRDYLPGTIPQPIQASAYQGPKSNSRIHIYQDDDVDGGMKGSSSILDHIPTEEAIHKENTIKPGPWNTGAKKCSLIPSAVKTSFKIHEDQPEDLDSRKVRLFPNHVAFFDASRSYDQFSIPVFVPDPPNSNVILKPHYPKELVYANSQDISLEEIKAQRYFERRKAQQENSKIQDNIPERLVDVERQCELAEQRLQFEHQQELNRLQQQEIQRQYYEAEKQKLEKQRHEAEQLERHKQQLEIKRAAEIERQQREAELEKQRMEAERLEAQRREAERLEAQRMEAERLEAQRMEAERLEAQRMEAERLEAQRMEAERLEAERLEAQRMEAELNRQQKLQTSSYMSQHVEHEEHLLSQSLTVNTKEARSVMQDLWQSPEPRNNRISSMTHRLSLVNNLKFPFDIHMDSSMTQHAMSSNSKHHPSYGVQTVQTVQPYNDQENQRHFHNSYVTQEQPHQNSFSVHTPIQNSYHLQNSFQIQQHHEHMQQPLHHQQHMQQPHHTSQLQPHPHHPQTHIQTHHSPHIQTQQQHIHHTMHMQPHHQHIQVEHQTTHISPQQHMPQHQHHSYNDVVPNNMSYQQHYGSPLQQPHASHHQNSLESQKQLHFPHYTEADTTSKPYRMPTELPYIKSPGINRRDLKYLESAEDKENAIALDYNRPTIEENVPKHSEENELYTDESLGIAPLPDNETCYMDAFNAQLTSSTPITNHFKSTYKPKNEHQFSTPQSQHVPSNQVTPPEVDDKLSTIMEATRENFSSSSGSLRNAGLAFTLTREDLETIKEQSSLVQENTDKQLSSNQLYEQKMRAQIQAVHAQSPRTVQRNVDKITSEIKNNCDLRKSISFKFNDESIVGSEDAKIEENRMDYEDNEPMEQVEDVHVEERKENVLLKEEDDEEPFELPENGDIDPFDRNLIAGLLRKMKFPKSHHSDGYVVLNTNLNKFVPSTTITLGNEIYDLEKCLGKGTYGTVFKAVNVHTRKTVALKTQKPAWVWEYYIAREIKARLTNPHMLRGFMDIDTAYVAHNGSVLVSEFSKYGTLLAVTNQVKVTTGKPLPESLAIFFTIEMLQIVEYLHKCQIIHGDIKPDNFLLMHAPSEDVRPTIQLIDFGCSIDMSLFPEDTKFTHVIKTEDFTCIEMKTGKSWTYQTDLYCLAASSHCLLFGNYMRVSHVGGRWFINSKIPRYARGAAWETFFTELLNVESCEKMPDLTKLKNVMDEALSQLPEKETKLRHLSNLLNKR